MARIDSYGRYGPLWQLWPLWPVVGRNGAMMARSTKILALFRHGSGPVVGTVPGTVLALFPAKVGHYGRYGLRTIY